MSATPPPMSSTPSRLTRQVMLSGPNRPASDIPGALYPSGGADAPPPTSITPRRGRSSDEAAQVTLSGQKGGIGDPTLLLGVVARGAVLERFDPPLDHAPERWRFHLVKGVVVPVDNTDRRRRARQH